MLRRTRRFAAGLLLASLTAGGARADTLREALARVYATNPTLTGARAGQRVTDENVPIARAAGLPDLAVTGSYNEFVKRSPNAFTAPLRAASAGLSLTVPIYQGGQIRNAVKAADARVDQGRANLRSTEAQLFVEAVAAYMDVIRTESIIGLNESNARVLETNLRASRDRFEVGDLTRTDVAQSEARLAVARSQLESARAEFNAARENYLRVVGAFPANLEPPPPLPQLPKQSEDAADIAIENNPQLDAARQASRAADYDIGVARSFRLPRISAVGSGDYVNYLNTLGGTGTGALFAQTQTTATVGLQGSLPLFQGGEGGARVRQAQASKSQTIEQVTQIERGVISDARTAFARYIAAAEVIRSSETAVQANELALEGVRAEESVGTRTVLDVLDAEQELLNSRVTLVTARRDAYVLGFQLLAAMGKAEARDLGLEGGALYDPEINYRRVRNSINDFAQDPKPVPVATRTVAIPEPAVPAVKPAQPITQQGTKSPATTAPITASPLATPPVTTPKR